MWLGFSDIIKEGQFLALSDRKRPRYANWTQGAPYNGHGGTEHTVPCIGLQEKVGMMRGVQLDWIMYVLNSVFCLYLTLNMILNGFFLLMNND